MSTHKKSTKPAVSASCSSAHPDAPYQQGDVLMIPCKSIPAAAKPVLAKNGRLTLAEGEATGHSHSIMAEKGAELRRHDQTMFLTLKEPTTITHEEHKPIDLPAGTYEIRLVREVDPFADEIRRVQD